MECIDDLELSEELLEFVATAMYVTCDGCNTQMKDGQAWYGDRQKDLDYCGQCVKALALNTDELFCFHDGICPSDNPWVALPYGCFTSELLCMNAVPDRDMSGVTLPEQEVLTEWYNFMKILFTEEIEYDFEPNGPAFGNIRGWVPLAMKGVPAVEKENLEAYRVKKQPCGNATNGHESDSDSDTDSDTEDCAEYEYPIPTFLAINCNRGAPQRQLALFSYNPIEEELFASLLPCGGNESIDHVIQSFQPKLVRA